MLTAAVFVGLLAFVSAYGGNMMGNWGTNPFGQGMYRQNMGHSGYMNQGQGYGNNGMMSMSQLFKYLSGQTGQNGGYNAGGGMNGGYMGGSTGGNANGGYMSGGQYGSYGSSMGGGQMYGKQMHGAGGQQGMLGGLTMFMLLNLLQNRDGNQGNKGNQMSEGEMEYVEKMMKKKMMMEMTEMLAMHMDYKEKESEFKQSMEHLCYLVNVTYSAYKNNGTEVFSETDDDTMETMEKAVEHMSEREKSDYFSKMVLREQNKFGEVFLRLATWACMSGDDYVKSAMKMEKMEKGECESEKERD